jgi:putative hydrolase of the HAD superfamily
VKTSEGVIQTVIFDLGGVLIQDPSAGMTAYFASYFQVDKEALQEALKEHWDAWHRGRLTESDLWQQVTADLPIHNPPYVSLWLDGYKQVCRKKPEMLLLLKQLKNQGYTTALLSNTEAPLVGSFRQLLGEDIDRCFFSCEMGLRKPESAIYERTLQELDCKPENVVFIDDRQENVDAAARLGIPSIVFRDCDDLKQQLPRYSISL